MLERTVATISTSRGPRTVDAFVDPQVPGLAFTRVPKRGWTITHLSSGCALTPHSRTRKALEEILHDIAALRDWSRPLPARNGRSWKELQNKLLTYTVDLGL